MTNIKRSKRGLRGKLGRVYQAGLVFVFVGVTAFAIGNPTGEVLYNIPYDIIRVVITALFGIIAWFLVKTLNKIDTNQNDIFQRLRVVENESAITRARCDTILCLTPEHKHASTNEKV